MNGLSNDMLESYMNSLKYAEVVIKYVPMAAPTSVGTTTDSKGVTALPRKVVGSMPNLSG